MTKAPERIWAWPAKDAGSSVFGWADNTHRQAEASEYIRADKVQELIAEEREAYAKVADAAHEMWAFFKGRNPADYVSGFSRIAAVIRARGDGQ